MFAIQIGIYVTYVSANIFLSECKLDLEANICDFPSECVWNTQKSIKKKAKAKDPFSKKYWQKGSYSSYKLNVESLHFKWD